MSNIFFLIHLFRQTHFDIPFNKKLTTLHAMVGVMVYLLTVIGAFSLSVEQLTSIWENHLSNSITVQVAFDSSLPIKLQEKKLEIVKKKIMEIPGIRKVTRSNIDIHTFLQPWLGKNFSFNGLPVPFLLYVNVDHTINKHTIATCVKRYAQYFMIKDNTFWLKRATLFHKLSIGFGVLFFSLLIIMIILILIASVRISLIEHQDVVRILHNVGAVDNYIIIQFIVYTVRIIFFSTLIGFFIGSVTISTVLFFFWIEGMVFFFSHIYWLLLLPIFITCIGWLVAYYCVKRELLLYV